MMHGRAWSVVLFGMWLSWTSVAWARINLPEPAKTPTIAPVPQEKYICPSATKLPKVERSDVYKNRPYGAGESAEYDVRYGGVLVGRGVMDVRPPVLYDAGTGEKVWHQSFHVDGKTGDWYKLIFVAHDQVDALVRPWDHGVSKFFLEQDEGQLFGKRLQQKKWLDFRHEKCRVYEATERVGKPRKEEDFELHAGALDTVGITYWLREQNFEIGKKIRALIYSSEKNWWLEAEPLAVEDVKTAAGTFKTTKMRLQTYIGKELQQKGDVYVWIGNDLPSRPLVQVKADIRLGSVWIQLKNFKAGK